MKRGETKRVARHSSGHAASHAHSRPPAPHERMQSLHKHPPRHAATSPARGGETRFCWTGDNGTRARTRRRASVQSNTHARRGPSSREHWHKDPLGSACGELGVNDCGRSCADLGHVRCGPLPAKLQENRLSMPAERGAAQRQGYNVGAAGWGLVKM